MRFSLSSNKRYLTSSHYEIDKRENSELIHEINLRFVPRAPAGGGGRGGGGGGGGGRGGGSGGGGSSGSSGGSRGGVSFSGSSGSRGASSYGRGGGSPTTIASGAFAGRLMGGGTRDQVYGSSRYGSGYTYGGGSYVAGRGFPFGYWPVFVPIGAGAGYYGYREYGPANNSSRPGGPMQQALVRSSDWPQDSSGGGGANSTTVNNATASYYIVGDADSIAAVMEALVQSCSVVNASGTAVDDNNPAVHVEQAVQYYRASSFMLALSSYNNTANLPSNAPADNSTAPPPPTADTPLPAGTNMTFLNCLNETIGAAVPIMDAAPGTLRATTSLNVVGLLWLMLWLLKVF